MKVRNIEVGNKVGESQKFRIYTGETDDEQQVILKVAKTFEDGDVLADEAGKFNILRTFESQVSKMQEELGETSSHYEWLFANLIQSFMEPSQGDRRINVFTIPDINLSDLTPLTKLSTDTKIDARTSVWVLGRFLKLYAFYELIAEANDEVATKYPLFSPDDYLIGPEKHRLIYYNFSGEVNDVIAFDFVKSITRFILGWVDIEDDPAQQEYLELLEDFEKNGRKTCAEAHEDLYDLVKKLWGISYHPFTYKSQNSTQWKNIEEE